MEKTKKRKASPRNATPYEVALHLASEMRYSDLKAACIMRGMLFEDVIEGDHNDLHTFFVNSFIRDAPVKRALLEEFDIWLDQQLEKRGYDKDDPVRQFRQFSEEQGDGEEQEVVTKRSKVKKGLPKKKKTRRERDSQFNIFKGTCKAYTYDTAKDCWDKVSAKYNRDTKAIFKKFADKAVSRVHKQFPDGKDKSIKIWFKRALNELASKNK